MVVRKRKKRPKMLGQRTRGNGDTKRRRGAGSRGGRGLAGSHKHKWSKYHGKFGKEKKQVRSKKIVREINIDQLMQKLPAFLEKGLVSKEGKAIILDGEKAGFDKLLSKGSLEIELIVRNMKASKKSVEKVKKAGGTVEDFLEEKMEEGPGKEGQAEKEKEPEKEGPEKKEAREEKPGKEGRKE